MKQNLLWIGLFILAHILEPILRFIGFIWAMIRSKNRLKYIKECANSIDQTVNAFGAEMFTDWWVKSGGYKHGNSDETLSSAMGKNERLNKLTDGFFMGKWWNKLLDKIDYDHTTNSIEENP